MDPKTYRRQYEAELAAGTFRPVAAPAPGAVGSVTTAVAHPGGAAPARAADQWAQQIGDAVDALRDPARPTEARRQALRVLKAARFLGERFAPVRAEVLGILRTVARAGSGDLRLKHEAIEILAAEKDAWAQDLIRKDLRHPSADSLPQATALRLLSLDDHADAADRAADVFQSSPDLPTREVALRVMGAKPAIANDLYAALLADKSQPRSLREISAAGLSAGDPARFSAIAKDIVSDATDHSDIRATALGVLANASGGTSMAADAAFSSEVHALAAGGPTDDLRASASRLAHLHRP